MAQRQASQTPEQDTPQIPDRLFFRIGDVGGLTGVETYVLRFWESEFPMLSPKKSSNGQRQYRRKDVETVLEIKRLLYDEGYTIAGARKALKDRARHKKRPVTEKRQSALPLTTDAKPGAEAIDSIKKELEDILSMLKKH